MSRLRIVFMGTPEFAVPTLQALLDGPDEVVLVVTQPDRPAGRRRHLLAPPVKGVAEAAGRPLIQPLKLTDEAVFERIASTRPDVCVVVAYGKILRPRLLALPAHGCLNVHASLLPRWRGAAPINWAMAAGDRETGVTIQQIDEGLDTGPVVRQWATPIDPLETAGELHDRLAPEGARLMADVLAELRNTGELDATPQDSSASTYARMLKKSDGWIDFERPARLFVAHVHGMTPWPGAVCTTPRGPIKLLRCRPTDAHGPAGQPGQVVSASPADGLVLATRDGLVEVLEIQPPGRPAMRSADYLNGLRLDITGELWENGGSGAST